MADPSFSQPSSSGPDEAPRPPTFVQIVDPAPSTARKMLVVAGGGTALAVALATVLGWAAYRLTADQGAPVVMQPEPAPRVTKSPSPEPPPVDLKAELARLAIDATVSSPVWHRESLMDRISPFDATVAESPMPAAAPAMETRHADQAGTHEVSVRLGKGDTIGSVLQRLGFEAEVVADAVSALTPHVRLKRLPIGLGMTLYIQPPGKEGDKPILQALTIQPDGRREITVERDGDGQYVVERPPVRSTTR